jgi:hypothetical protein
MRKPWMSEDARMAIFDAAAFTLGARAASADNKDVGTEWR